MKNTVLLLIVAACFALFFELGRMDVVMDNEGQRTVPPQEMLHSGDYVIPTQNGDTYLAKPPLLYWAIAGVYQVTGTVNEWTARIPTAFCGVLLVLCIYGLIRRRAGEKVALWTALAFLTSYYFLERARWAEIDTPLALFTFLAIMAFWRSGEAESAGKRAALTAGAAVALAAAFMLKGPVPVPFLWAAWAALQLTRSDDTRIPRYAWILTAVAVVIETVVWALGSPLTFPLALVIALGAWSVAAVSAEPGRALRDFGRLAIAVVAGAALCAPWAIAVVQRMGWDYIQGLLNYQVVERTYTASEINSGSPFFFLIALPALLAPWGLLLPLHLSRANAQHQPGVYRQALAMGWLSVLVFSLIAGKENEYILPAFPFLLLPTGFHLAQIAEKTGPAWVERWRGLWLAAVRALLLVVAIGGPVYVFLEEGEHTVLLVEVVAASVITVAIFIASRGAAMRRLWGAWAMVLIMTVAGLTVRSFHYTGENSFRPVGQLAGALARGGHDVAVNRLYPALVHYADHRVPIETDVIKAARKLNGEEPYYFILREKELALFAAQGDVKGVNVLAGPWSNKDLVVIGNAPLPAGAAE